MKRIKMKKVRLNQNDIQKIVKRVVNESESRDTFEFKYEYSRNLMATEREFLNDDDKLQDIIDVYQSHIQQLRSIIKNNKDRTERAKGNVNEEIDLDPNIWDDESKGRFEIVYAQPERVTVEVKDNVLNETYDVTMEYSYKGGGDIDVTEIYPYIEEIEDEDALIDFLKDKKDDFFRDL